MDKLIRIFEIKKKIAFKTVVGGGPIKFEFVCKQQQLQMDGGFL
jgi:hypothetical protein